MREGECKVMALCDAEEEYAQLMTEFMKKQKNLPWELHTYTNADTLLGVEREGIDMLVVAESAFCQELRELSPRCMVVLGESGVMRWEDISYVDKYQEAEEVLKQLLGVYMETADVQLPFLRTNRKTVFIGNYSPVHRCMQTSFAITMSLMLARRHPTLYLNFEHYAGISELLPDMQTLDMADLLYFLNAQKDKFRLRLQTILKHKGALAYVPPMKSGQNLITVTPKEWLGLLERIEELEEYEYVVLDLTESMQGLFEILRMCRHVYTLTREDRIARGKLLQYEQVLALYEYGDVLGKTKRLALPHIQKLPEELEQLTKGDLADLVKGLLRNLEEGGDG
ncbi:MAG: hypothetical protein HFH97_05620 [Lachnospiraceae bacterium]|nr:hypothetical protein [uncultured Acetatifactor sp.]MCI9572075.1 hypothetical protein [Lachnospiraceae bacterium]